MLVMAARAATRLHKALQAEVSVMKEREAMSRMMAVCVFQKAGHAKIIVFAVSACDHLGLVKICQELATTETSCDNRQLTLETSVADPLRRLKWVLFSCIWSRLRGLLGSELRQSFRPRPRLSRFLNLARSHSFSSAVSDNAIFDNTLDQPVIFRLT
jgi:hypothetical protein